MSTGETSQYRDCILRFQAGDDGALDELLSHFEDRLIQLSHRMLGQFPKVQRWEQTGDVFAEAMIRLQKALLTVTPAHTRDFLNLAALQIRRELLSLAEAHRARASPSQAAAGDENASNPMIEPTSNTDGPDELAMWTEFHERAGALEEELREVFDLIWYHDMTQLEAADLLGVSERTVRYRWQKARLALREALSGHLPGL
jgi:RNA polymerase sigma factor (sigma-70 family)